MVQAATQPDNGDFATKGDLRGLEERLLHQLLPAITSPTS